MRVRVASTIVRVVHRPNGPKRNGVWSREVLLQMLWADGDSGIDQKRRLKFANRIVSEVFRFNSDAGGRRAKPANLKSFPNIDTRKCGVFQ